MSSNLHLCTGLPAHRYTSDINQTSVTGQNAFASLDLSLISIKQLLDIADSMAQLAFSGNQATRQ
jgi:hypothetical protein